MSWNNKEEIFILIIILNVVNTAQYWLNLQLYFGLIFSF